MKETKILKKSIKKVKSRFVFNNKKVIVTGASGFVGKSLTNKLRKKNASVYDFSGDVRDFQQILSFFKKVRPSVVYHLAAQPLIEIGKTSPVETFDVNIRGSWNVLEAARQLGVEKIVLASTTHVYGNNPNLPYKEEYYPQPSRPYETSKASADLLAQTYADTYNLPVEICRMVNLYGPGDSNMSRIFPYVINKLNKGENPVAFDVGAVRDFLYIDDAVDGYIKIVEANLPDIRRTRVFNFGTGKPVNVLELIQKIINIYGAKDRKVVIKPLPKEREKEIQKQYVSTEKAKRLLGWSPKTDLHKGIKKTINFYKKAFKLI